LDSISKPVPNGTGFFILPLQSQKNEGRRVFGVLRFIREKDNSKENIKWNSRLSAAPKLLQKSVTIHSVGSLATT